MKYGVASLVLLAFLSCLLRTSQAQNYSVASCGSASNTTVTGTVYDPAGKNPIPNVLVYVPQGSLTAFTDGVNATMPTRDNFANLVSGNPLVQSTTSSAGTFSLSGVPAGTGVPLVIQAGRWRRQFLISSVAACTTTPLYSVAVTTVGTDPSNLNTSNLTQGGSNSLSGFGEFTSLRFPRTQNEGNIPKIAMVTGSADALECTLRKVGINDSEFTDINIGINSTSGNSTVSNSSPSGRINLYRRNPSGAAGAEAPSYTGSTTAVSTIHTAYDLFSNTASLDSYNVLMLPCAGSGDATLESGGSNIADAQNVAAFANAGGRLFSTHFSSDLLDTVSSISGAANWVTPGTPSTTTGTATINSVSTDSQLMGEWLYGLNAGTEDQVAVSNLRVSQTGTNSPTVNWATVVGANWSYNSSTITNPIVEFSYYTPFTATSTAGQYGRVFFTDYHVNGASSGSAVYPTECTSTMGKTAAMSTQEQMLEYSLFQLMNFAVPQFSPNVSVTLTSSPTTLIAGDTGDNIVSTITNNSNTQPITLDAPVTLMMNMPAGITATSASGSGWNCTTTGAAVTCLLSSPLAPGASGSVDVIVNVASSVTPGSNTISGSLSSEEFTSNVSFSVPVSAAAATLTSTVLNPSSTTPSYGSSLTLTATVTTAANTPTGNVTFYDGATVLGTVNLGSNAVASLSVSGLAVGSHTFEAVYNRNSPYASSTSGPATATVIASTATALSASASSVTLGSPVTFTATVSSAAGVPSGTVTFYDGSIALGTGTLNSNGTATYPTSALSAGPHVVTAVYTATSSYTSSTSSAATVTINAASTTTALSASASSVTLGSPVTFTATVSSAAGVPSGTVTFYDGSIALGTGTLNSNGTATYPTSALSAGPHVVTAVYTATSSYTSSTSSAATVTINAASTTTALSASASSVTLGSPVTFTATVSSAAGVPSGTVTFYDGSIALGTGTLNRNGTATYPTSALSAGPHVVTAVYTATSSYTSSTSPAATVTINAASTTTALSASASSVTLGSPVTFTATVSSTAGTPGGTATFYDGSTVLGTGTLNSNGTATYPTSALSAGPHVVTAVYTATSSYTSSTSPAATVTINAASTTTALSASASSVTLGSPVTFTATVSSTAGTPGGTATFYDGSTVLGTGTLNSNGTATYPTSALSAGPHVVTAVYTATSSYTSSTSPAATVTINAASTTTALSASASSVTLGSPVTFTATVSSTAGTPGGTATFYDGSTVLGTGTLNSNGTATYPTSALSAGPHVVTAVYTATSSYTSSTSPAATVTINAASTTTALSASASSVTLGSPVTFTATVSSTAGTPGGTATFYDGSTVLGTGTLNSNGTATYPTSALSAGPHVVTAVYTATSSYTSSTSSAATVTINAASTTTALSASASSVTLGSPVTFTATVSSASGVPSGTVTFYDGSIALGTGTLNSNGTATYPTSALSAGPHVVTAVYTATSSYTSSTSSAATVTINAASVATSPISPTIAPGGNLGTVTVTIVDATGNPVTGSSTLVTLSITGPAGYSQTLTATAVHGVAVSDLSSLTLTTPGAYTLTITAAGKTSTANFTVAVIVPQDFGVTTASGSPSASVLPGTAVSFTLTLSPDRSGFTNPITLTATGLPAGSTYSFSPNIITPKSSEATTILTIQTSSTEARTSTGLGLNPSMLTLALLLVPFGISRRTRKRLRQSRCFSLVVSLMVIGGLITLTGCGTTNGFFGQAPHSYIITVTGTSGSLSHSTVVVLNVQ